jgi:hypothetical protein
MIAREMGGEIPIPINKSDRCARHDLKVNVQSHL